MQTYGWIELHFLYELENIANDFSHRFVAQVINLTGQHGSLALQREGSNDHLV